MQEVRSAIPYLCRKRLVSGRCASYRRRDITVVERQAVMAVGRTCLICKPKLIECTVEPVAAPVTGKYSAGSVATMSRRGETDHQEPSPNVTERGHRPPPIVLPSESTCFEAGHSLSMLDQPGAETTSDYLSLQRDQARFRHGSPRTLVETRIILASDDELKRSTPFADRAPLDRQWRSKPTGGRKWGY